MKKWLTICATACVLVTITSAAAHAQWATLKGQFLYGERGDIPKRAKIVATKNPEFCGKFDLFDEKLVVNAKNRGLQNVILWLSSKKPPKAHPDYANTAEDVIMMNNLNCRFDPHVVLVRTSQKFRVGNADPIGHNALINFLKNSPVNPLVPAGGKVPDFDLGNPELLPTPVSCSIHPWMNGVVLVQDHPYMASTDEDGKFEIKNLPAGKHTFKVWHEKIGYLKGVTIDGKKETFKRGRYLIELKAGDDQDHKYVVDTAPFEK